MDSPTVETLVREVIGDRFPLVGVTLIEDKFTGSFKGVAFVNFRRPDHATAALTEFAKLVVNGRKVIAEYRRPRSEKNFDKRQKKYENSSTPRSAYNHHFHGNNSNNRSGGPRHGNSRGGRGGGNKNSNNGDKRAAFFARREAARMTLEQSRDEQSLRDKQRETEFRNLLLEYGQGALEDDTTAVKDLVFDASLTSYERRMVHSICDELGLGHISRVDEDGNRVLHVTKDPQRTVEWEQEAEAAKTEARKHGQEMRRRKLEELMQKQQTPDEANATADDNEAGGTPSSSRFKSRNGGASSAGNKSATGGLRMPNFKVYVPPTKPSGPDGTIGFTRRVKKTEECGLVGLNGIGGGSGKLGKDETDVDMVDVAADTDGEKGETNEKKNGMGAGNIGGLHSVLNPSVPAFEPSNGGVGSGHLL